jgi:hypothetical protein
MRNSLLAAATALALLCGAAAAQDQSPQHTTGAPTELQGMPPDKPAVATVAEAATDVAGLPRGSQTSGQAPNVSRRMGAEMDSGRHLTNSSWHRNPNARAN